MCDFNQLEIGQVQIAVPSFGEELAGLYRARAELRTQDPSSYYGAARDFRSADYWYRFAAACSIGHNRTARYEQSARECWTAAQEYFAKWVDDIYGSGNGN